MNDIDLKKAIIQVPLVARNNSRVLELTALQVVELQEYLKDARKELEQFKSHQLFITGGPSKDLNNSLSRLKKKVQEGFPKLQNLAHWRSSIIVHWVKNLQQQLSLHHPLQ